MGNYPQDSDPLRSAHEAIVVGDLERAIAILRSSLESDLAIDPAIRVRAKLALADALRQTGRLMEAATSVDQALASALHDLGKGSPLYALALSDTGVQRHFENDLASARDFYERAIAAYEDMEYPPAAAFATSLANLGTILSRHFQEFGEAEECLKRSLLLCDTLPNSDVLRDDLEGSLADFYNEIGNHRAAADIIEHVLDRRRRLFTTPNGAVAKTLLALGHQYAALGRLADATNVLTEARAVYAQVIAPSDIRYGSACRELASVHQSLGNHHQALNLHIEAEESFLPALGPKHPWTLRNRLGKAHSLHMLGQHDKSAEMIKKVISGFRDEYGETSRDYAQVLHEYGTLLARQGSSDQAASLLRAAREIRATLLGVNSFDYAVTLNSEASVHSALGRTAEAVSLLTQAVQIFERLDTTNHITYSTVLANLAIELGRSQDYEAAQSAMAKAAAIDDAIVRRAYLLGRRHARIGLAERIRANVVVAIGLAACSTDRAGSLVEAAATFVLRYKGIEYELESSLNETLTQTLREHDRQALERLRQLETDIAAAESSDSLNTAASTDLHSLRMQADRLSMQIWSAVGNESSISLTQKVTAHDLQSALEYRDGVLEYAVYVPITTAAPESNAELSAESDVGQFQLGCFVFTAHGPTRFVQLGSLSVVLAAIESFLSEIRSSRWNKVLSSTAEAARSVLFQTIIHPVQPFIADVARLTVCTDGGLELVPYDLLLGEAIATSHITVTNSAVGRDLVKPIRYDRRMSPAAIFAAPDYDASRSSVHAEGDMKPANIRELLQLRQSDRLFRDLKGARLEGEAVRDLTGADLFAGERASKAALQELQSPLFLHFATHGFYSRREERAEALATPVSLIEYPIYRCGLALSGANTFWTEQSSPNLGGILTAAEASHLRLSGTRFVILSACDSAAGDVQIGEGVFSLHRAFLVAGASCVVGCLWPVEDRAARLLINELYTELVRGTPMRDALKAAKRVRRRAGSPIADWSAFVCYGDASATLMTRVGDRHENPGRQR